MNEMERYFSEKGVKPADVQAIVVERIRLNCFEVFFIIKDNAKIRVGPFSEETYDRLIKYWTTAN